MKELVYTAVGVLILVGVLAGVAAYMDNPKRGPVTPEERLIESHNRL